VTGSFLRGRVLQGPECQVHGSEDRCHGERVQWGWLEAQGLVHESDPRYIVPHGPSGAEPVCEECDVWAQYLGCGFEVAVAIVGAELPEEGCLADVVSACL
jgi:hypothetical protein